MSDGTSELEKRRLRRMAQKKQASGVANHAADADWDRIGRGGRDACEAMDGMNAPPVGVMMEMQLARERDRELGVKSESIVDQTQFRNTQLNEGYQHHTVVRQNTGNNSLVVEKIRDMTKAGREAAAERKRQRELAGGGKKRLKVEIAPGIFGFKTVDASEVDADSVKKEKKARKKEKKAKKRDKKAEKKKKKKKDKNKDKKQKKKEKRESKKDEEGAEGEEDPKGSSSSNAESSDDSADNQR